MPVIGTNEIPNITITIVADPESKTIYATPNNGNVFLGHPGQLITWQCSRPFQIQFVELSGTGARLHSQRTEDGRGLTVRLGETGTFFKYIVTVGNLVLDPYIGVDH